MSVLIREGAGAPGLSTVIVNWNTRDLLAQCLESVYAHPPDVAFDVWVVDNASCDGSAAMVRERFPDVHLIENDTNVGFARANNQAIRVSNGRYVLLLNSDTRVLPGALASMIALLDAQPQVGIAGAWLLNPDGSPQPCYGAPPTFLSEAAHAWGLDRWGWPGSAPRPSGDVTSFQAFRTGWVQGAALMVRRRLLDQVGLLDEGYFMYAEEMDWAWRMHAAGWSILCAPAARVIHHEGQSSRQFRERTFVELWRSRWRFFDRYYPPAWRWTARRLVRACLWITARRAARQGMPAAELANRQRAYREVAAL